MNEEKMELLRICGGDVDRAKVAFDWVNDEEGSGASKPATATRKKADKPAEGPSLEDVQNAIRELVENEANKPKIKAAIEKLGGKRAGDFESDPAKLKALSEALDAIGSEGSGSEEEEDLL